MKNTIKLLPLLLVIFSCKAQTFNIESYDGEPINGAYYKDINNTFNPFVGTWLYTNGTISFKIVLEKRTYTPTINQAFEDLLVGEYEYKVNNIVKVSTLSNINNTFMRGNNINASSILKGGTRACRNCPATDIFINGVIGETVGTGDGLSTMNSNNNHRYYGEIFMKRITVNGQHALEFSFYWKISSYDKNLPKPQDASFPAGTYIMIKQ